MEGVKQFPVGSVCIVIGVDSAYDMIGKEVTITGPLELRYSNLTDVVWEGYSTDAITAKGLAYTPQHSYLKLKEPPKDSSSERDEIANREAFERFMDRVLFPVSMTEEV